MTVVFTLEVEFVNDLVSVKNSLTEAIAGCLESNDFTLGIVEITEE